MLLSFDPRARYLTGAPPPFNPRARYLSSRRMAGLRGLRGLGADPTLDPVDFAVTTPAFDFTNPAATFGPLETTSTPQAVYQPNFVGPLPPGSVELSTPAAVSADQAAVSNLFTAQPTLPNTPQAAAAIAAGAVALNAAGQFINASGKVVAVPGTSLIAGVPNTYLWMALGGVALFGLLTGARGGRR